jgi:hypothetical protein
MSDRKIEFRGRLVIEGWPDELAASQEVETVRPNGLEMPRVRYGDEADDWGADRGPCHDCVAIKGEFHAVGCDVERCPACGGQIGVCECDWPDEDETG